MTTCTTPPVKPFTVRTYKKWLRHIRTHLERAEVQANVCGIMDWHTADAIRYNMVVLMRYADKMAYTPETKKFVRKIDNGYKITISRIEKGQDKPKRRKK